MERPSKRRLAFALAGTSTLAIAMAAWLVHDTANARWRDAKAWMAGQQVVFDRREFHRPVLHGESTSGTAFAHYDSAARLAGELIREHGDESLRALWLRPETLPDAERTATCARWTPAIAALRTGAHCDEARPTRTFAADAEPTNLLAGRWLTNMTCVEARESLTADRDAAAVACTLDAATYGADLVRSPLVIDQMIGNALVAIATTEFWSDGRLAMLDRPALDLLADGLDRLDQRLPIHLDLVGEALYVAQMLTDGSQGLDELQLSALSAWRYGCSSRWMLADSILEIGRSLDRLGTTVGRPWPEREAALEAEAARLSASNNAIVQMAWPMLVRIEGSALRTSVAKLRLLRVAVDVRRGRPIPTLDDPLGDGAIDTTETTDGIRVTSAGRHDDRQFERLVAHPAPR